MLSGGDLDPRYATQRGQFVNELKKGNVGIYAVRVGPRSDPTQLNRVASRPSYVLNPKTYGQLPAERQPLIRAIQGLFQKRVFQAKDCGGFLLKCSYS